MTGNSGRVRFVLTEGRSPSCSYNECQVLHLWRTCQKTNGAPSYCWPERDFRSSGHLIMQVICEFLYKLYALVLNNCLATTYNSICQDLQPRRGRRNSLVNLSRQCVKYIFIPLWRLQRTIYYISSCGLHRSIFLYLCFVSRDICHRLFF